MYAIVKTGGKQYRVEKGQTLVVERLAEKEGAKIALEPLLYRSDSVAFESADLAKIKVEAKIVEHMRGPKLRVFKFKPKRGYKRTTGHRQELTRIEVTDIKQAAARAQAKAEAPEANPKTAAAKSRATATKPKATVAKPKAAAKKPAAKKSVKDEKDGA